MYAKGDMNPMAKQRNGSFDFLKIIATLVIIFHHYQQVLQVKFDHAINFYGGNFFFGYFVELFFLISGFFMLRYIEKIRDGMSFRQFFVRRYTRLVPMLVFGVILYQLMAFLYLKQTGALWGEKGFSFWSTLISCAGLQDGWIFKNPGLNNPLWYVSVLILCYAIFYLLTKVSGRLNVSDTCLYVGMILLGLGIHSWQIDLPFLNFDAARGYYAFFTGLLLARWFKALQPKAGQLCAAGVLLVILTLLFAMAPAFMSTGANYTLTFLYFPALLFIFNFWKPIRKLTDFGFIRSISEISYCAYAIHQPCLIALSIIAAARPDWISTYVSLKLMIVFALFCFIAGAVIHYIYEKPLDSWFKKHIQ